MQTVYNHSQHFITISSSRQSFRMNGLSVIMKLILHQLSFAMSLCMHKLTALADMTVFVQDTCNFLLLLAHTFNIPTFSTLVYHFRKPFRRFSLPISLISLLLRREHSFCRRRHHRDGFSHHGIRHGPLHHPLDVLRWVFRNVQHPQRD